MKTHMRYIYMECFILFLVGVSPFIILSKGVYLSYGDYNSQIIPFWTHIYDMFQNGSPAWDWQSGLGMNYIGSYSFYGLASPYTLISLLFSRRYLPYAMTLINASKFGVAGVCAYLYCEQYTKKDESAHMCGILYAFSGIQLFNMVFHFSDIISFFPLLLYSFDKLVIEKKKGMFAILLAVSGFTNYYFFFGECVFILIYFIVKVFCKAFTIDRKLFVTIAFETLIGISLTSVLLLPSYYVLQGNVRAGNSILNNSLISFNENDTLWKIIYSMFFIPDLCSRPGIFSGTQLNVASVSIYIPLFSILGVIIILKNERKLWYSRIVVVCAVFAVLPITNSIFSAFNSNYYARWFYMPLLIMIMMTGKYIDDFYKYDILPEIKALGAIYVFFLIFGINKIVGSLDHQYIISAISFSVLSTLFVFFVRYKKQDNFQKNMLKLVALFSCIPFLIAAISVESINLWEHTSNFLSENYNNFYGLSIDDDEYFRTVSDNDKRTNSTLSYGYPSVSMFHSLVTGNESEFYDYVGKYRESNNDNDRKNYAIHTFLSVKYDIYYNQLLAGGIETEAKNVFYYRKGFEQKNVQNRYIIYENKNFIPMGFTYDHYIHIDEFTKYSEDNNIDKDESYRREKLLLKAIWLTDEQIEKYKNVLAELSDSLKEDTSDETYVIDCDHRRKNAAYEFIPDKSGFTSKIKLDKDNLVFYSIPYDEGFSAYVDGERVEIERVFGGLCAVHASKGDHVIRFDYTVRGLKCGAIISIISLTVFIIYIVANISKTNKK